MSPPSAPREGKPRACGLVAARCRGDSRRGRRPRLVKAARVRSPRAMPGPRNLITDVPGILVGNAARRAARLRRHRRPVRGSRPSLPASCSAARRRNRDAACLEPEMAVERVDAVVLSGGSGLWARCRVRRAGLSARERRRLHDRTRCTCRSCRRRSASTSSTAATRIGAATRPTASSATRRCRRPRADFALGRPGGGYGATTVEPQGRPRLGEHGDAVRLHGRGSRRRQRHRLGHDRRTGRISGPPLRRGRRVRRARLRRRASAGDAPIRLEGRRRSRRTTIALVATDADLPSRWPSVSPSPPMSASPRRSTCRTRSSTATPSSPSRPGASPCPIRPTTSSKSARRDQLPGPRHRARRV